MKRALHDHSQNWGLELFLKTKKQMRENFKGRKNN